MISIIVISKDENALDYTLSALIEIKQARRDVEVLVVDASGGRLNHLQREHLTWIDFEPAPDLRRSIPHQRNAGVSKAKGDIIVFTDAGCEPAPGWLEALTGPIVEGRERVVTGVAISRAGESSYDAATHAVGNGYVEECATINVAFERSVFDEVGGFDESFDYGSDVDFFWRVRDTGTVIYRTIDALVTHDWGTRRRQAKRSFVYGQARARLYRKHRARRKNLLRNDPVAVVYPLFLVTLPLSLWFRPYLMLIAVPILKNRGDHPIRVTLDHLLYGAGVLRELLRR